MEKAVQKKGLGRGLSALMGDIDVSPSGSSVLDRFLPIEKLKANLNQPRRDFDEDSLKELAASIKSKGIIQPIVVRQSKGNESYEIVAGERRWRAAQIAGLDRVPVVVRELTDDEVLEIAIVENIQREDLNSIEEALAFRQLMDRFGHTQEQLSEALAKSRSHIANTLRLLNLPDLVQKMIRAGKLSAGHARALIGNENAESLAQQIVDKKLSVREVESLVQKAKGIRSKSHNSLIKKEKDLDTLALEADLSAILSMRVSIDHLENSSGMLTISFNDLDQLDQLCRRLSGE